MIRIGASVVLAAGCAVPDAEVSSGATTGGSSTGPAADASSSDASSSDASSGPGDEPAVPAPSWKQWEVGPDRYEIPAERTTYACFGVTVDVPTLTHVVGFEARVDATAHVHHMIVGTSKNPIDLIEPCHPAPPDTHALWGWAPGAEPMLLPPEAGFLVGDKGAQLHLVVQVHYDNPLEIEAMVDSTKVVLHHTGELRPEDAGIALLGDVDGLAIPAGQPAFETIHYCTGAWTELLLGEPIEVFGSWLHAHVLGRRLWTDLVRADGGRAELGRRDPYRFDDQYFEPLDVTVRPGDAMITHCIYDSTERTEPTLGGPASTDEMCLNYLLYYPRQPLFVYCNGS